MTTRKPIVAPSRGPLAGRSFASMQAYRTALAQLEGFASDHQRRQALRVARERAVLERLSESQRLARSRALEAVGVMRREGASLRAAARQVGTTPETVQRYAGAALLRRGRAFHARPVDHALREMAMVTLEGRRAVCVRSSRDASLIARHADAIRHYLATGDDSRLVAFRGRFVIDADGRRWGFMIDKLGLKRLGHAGELDFESIYAVAA